MWSMRDLTATHSLHSLTVRLLVVAAVIDFFFFPTTFYTTTFFCNLSNCVDCCFVWKLGAATASAEQQIRSKRRNSRAVCFLYKNKKQKCERSQRQDLKLERLCSVSDPPGRWNGHGGVSTSQLFCRLSARSDSSNALANTKLPQHSARAVGQLSSRPAELRCYIEPPSDSLTFPLPHALLM